MSAGLLKYRLAYSKLGKVRFLGHRDVARLWERTLRKAGVPVAVSTGFTPRARISFGLALPTGAESLIELLDFFVDPNMVQASGSAPSVDEWGERIAHALPEGFTSTHLHEIGSGDISLQESVTASSWILLVDHPDVVEAVDRVRSSDVVHLERERKGERHVDDIRPGILDINILDMNMLDMNMLDMNMLDMNMAQIDELEHLADVWPGDPLRSGSGTAISALLTTSGRGIRPTELVEALLAESEPWDHLTRVLRTQQWIDQDGQRIDVLSASMARPRVCA